MANYETGNGQSRHGVVSGVVTPKSISHDSLQDALDAGMNDPASVRARGFRVLLFATVDMQIEVRRQPVDQPVLRADVSYLCTYLSDGTWHVEKEARQ